MKKWLGILLTIALASCGGESTTAPANLLAKNDFEAIDGWNGQTSNPSLTKEKAHSGAYSISVRPGVDYSLGYPNILGKMSASRPQKIKLNAWAFVPNSRVNANLVIELHDAADPAKTLLYEAVTLSKEVKKFNEWQQIEHTITVPPAAKATSLFKLYLWRADSSQPVYVDDLTLALEDDAK